MAGDGRGPARYRQTEHPGLHTAQDFNADGLQGEDIPLPARIMAIADAFDAMSSKRIYRRLLNTDEILAELKKGRGRQFDPHILDVFIAEFEVDRKIYRAGESRLAEAIHAEIDFYQLTVRGPDMS